jgi:adenylate cyclase
MRVRRLRLITGLVLLTYLTTHFLNHALGLVSLEAMETGRTWFVALWRNPLATLALYGSLATHLALAFYSLYKRQHLRMPRWEAFQLVFGLLIPPLLVAHVIGTRLAHEWVGVNDSYTLIVLTLWVANPASGLNQAIVLAIAWTHGCIGLHFWLRLRSWYPRLLPLFFGFALLLPLLALLGFAEAGREISELIARDPSLFNRILFDANVPDSQERQFLALVQNRIREGFAATLALVLLARAVRHAYQRRNRVRITYPDGRVVAVPQGFSVLEASRLAAIPHASVCGGRGRCSTCRVRVASGLGSLPPPDPAEVRVLKRVGVSPNVRLACQLRPTTDLSVTPLLPANAQASDGFAEPSYLAGQERNIAVLFADLRSFTGIAEHRLPYDLVFILNSYFETLGTAITSAGGTIDKFIGDGVMALFGVESGPERGCREALMAANQIVTGVDKLSVLLAEELGEPLRVGIGIHCGPAVVGRMGYGEVVHLTAIGDTVNVASRLQDLCKEYSCQLVISQQVAREAELDVSSLRRDELSVRNRREALTIYIVNDPQTLTVKESKEHGARS